MSTDSTKTSSLRYFIIKYSFEFVVIIFGILISLLLEQNRQNNIEIDRKNNTVSQLINVIEEDINQINGFGKSFRAMTLDTVKGFLTDSKRSKFRI